MSESELKVQGQLIALRSTLSVLLAKLGEDDPKIVNRLHEVLARQIEQAIERGADDGLVGRAVARIQAASIGELDLIFATASGLLRGKPEV